jgi:hypothetical protein
MFERVEYLSMYWIFSHSGGSQAPPVTKASGPAAGYTGATPATIEEEARPTRVFRSDRVTNLCAQTTPGGINRQYWLG